MRLTIPAFCLLLCLCACDKETSAFPLALSDVQKMNAANTGQIEFEERGGEIFVTVIDKYGDGHIHLLNHEGVSHQDALSLLRQKQSELNK